jgi:hypothetical protein
MFAYVDSRGGSRRPYLAGQICLTIAAVCAKPLMDFRQGRGVRHLWTNPAYSTVSVRQGVKWGLRETLPVALSVAY